MEGKNEKTTKIVLFSCLLLVLLGLLIGFILGRNNSAKNIDIANDTAQTETDGDLSEETSEQVHIHTFSEATCTEPEKCACGETRGSVTEHTFSPAACTEPETCICRLTQGSVLEHSFSEASCDLPQTCTGCGATQGEALGHEYIVGECTVCGSYDPSYCPKLYFTGNMTGMNNKKDVRSITFEYRSAEQTISGSAEIKVQGSSSLLYVKKNYTITFFENAEYSNEMAIDVGWGAQDTYCLKANWVDKTHSRNVVTAKLAGEAQKKYGIFEDAPNNGAIDGFPVEVYINDSFHGLYTMNIPKEPWLFAMDEGNPNHIVISGENWHDPVVFRKVPVDFNDWEVEVGSDDDETLKKIQRLVKFVSESSDEEFKKNFEQYFDLDSTLNYYVFINYCWMADNVAKNMLLATYDGEVWYPSLYDLDTSWGTTWSGKFLDSYKNYLISTSRNLLWERMEELFKEEIAERYFELRSSVLDTDYVSAKFEEFYGSIPQEVIDRESEKWGKNQAIPGFPISQIQEYIDSVIPRLDEKYNEWRQDLA